MKLNKYRVKNCPAISFAGGCKNKEVKVWDCQDCTDCVMKQIYEKCENTIIQNPNQEDDTFEFDVGRESLGTEIIGLLDIQEVE